MILPRGNFFLSSSAHGCSDFEALSANLIRIHFRKNDMLGMPSPPDSIVAKVLAALKDAWRGYRNFRMVFSIAEI